MRADAPEVGLGALRRNDEGSATSGPRLAPSTQGAGSLGLRRPAADSRRRQRLTRSASHVLRDRCLPTELLPRQRRQGFRKSTLTFSVPCTASDTSGSQPDDGSLHHVRLDECAAVEWRVLWQQIGVRRPTWHQHIDGDARAFELLRGRRHECFVPGFGRTVHWRRAFTSVHSLRWLSARGRHWR